MGADARPRTEKHVPHLSNNHERAGWIKINALRMEKEMTTHTSILPGEFS